METKNENKPASEKKPARTVTKRIRQQSEWTEEAPLVDAAPPAVAAASMPAPVVVTPEIEVAPVFEFEPDPFEEAVAEFGAAQDIQLRVARLPNFERDGRADSRAKQAFCGLIQFTDRDAYETEIQQRWGAGAYRVEARAGGRIIGAKVLQLEAAASVAPVAAVPMPAVAPAPDLASLEERMIAGLERQAKLLKSLSAPPPAPDVVEQLERLEALRARFSPPVITPSATPAQEDDLTALIKQRLADKLLAQFDSDEAQTGPALETEPAPWWTQLLAPLIPALAPLAQAGAVYLMSRAQAQPDAPPTPAPQSPPAPPVLPASPADVPGPTAQPKSKSNPNPMNQLLAALIRDLKANEDVNKMADEIRHFIHAQPFWGSMLAGLLGQPPAALLQLLQNQVPTVNFAAMPHAEDWLGRLQSALNEAPQ